MNKLVLYITIAWFSLFGAKYALALPELNNEALRPRTEDYTKYVYSKISFKKTNKLSYEAFSKAFYGYLNLKEAGKVNNNALLTVCDFTLSSNVKRLWVIDVQKKKVLYNTLVAHGMGSGEEYATKFSNIENSHQTSLGFYITGEIYMGDNGYSMKLHGVDGMFNSNAFERAIVMHGADYVSQEFARDNERLGRSHGCPALPREVNDDIINKINNGNVLFIYHDSRDYLKKSHWLNNPIMRLPAEADMLNYVAKQSYEISPTNSNSNNTQDRFIEKEPTENATAAVKIPEPKKEISAKSTSQSLEAARTLTKKKKILMIYETYDSRGKLTVDTVFAEEPKKMLDVNSNSLKTTNANTSIGTISLEAKKD